MIDAPCADCQKRRVGCHSDCEDYKTWKSQQQTVADAKQKDKQRRAMLNGYAMQEVAKNTRKKRKER